MDYVFDWCLDDLPNWMRAAPRPLLALPYALELNDSVIHAVEKHATGEFGRRLEHTLNVYAREAAASGMPRVLTLGLHPHLMGVPHRYPDFEAMLDRLQRHSMTRFVTGAELYAWITCSTGAWTTVQLDARRRPLLAPALCAGAERFGDPCRGKARHRRARRLEHTLNALAREAAARPACARVLTLGCTHLMACRTATPISSAGPAPALFHDPLRHGAELYAWYAAAFRRCAARREIRHERRANHRERDAEPSWPVPPAPSTR